MTKIILKHAIPVGFILCVVTALLFPPLLILEYYKGNISLIEGLVIGIPLEVIVILLILFMIRSHFNPKTYEEKK